MKTKRLPKNVLKQLESLTGIPAKTLSDYVAHRIKPGGQRAFLLEDACRKLGLDVPARIWIEGPSQEIKAALKPLCELADQRREEERRQRERRQRERREAERRKRERRQRERRKKEGS